MLPQTIPQCSICGGPLYEGALPWKGGNNAQPPLMTWLDAGNLAGATRFSWGNLIRSRSGREPGGFVVPAIVVFAAPDLAAWRRPIGIGMGAIVVHGAAPTAHNITAHCPPAHDEDSDALAGAAASFRAGGPSVMYGLGHDIGCHASRHAVLAREAVQAVLVGVATG
jgi:hypothetical protein